MKLSYSTSLRFQRNQRTGCHESLSERRKGRMATTVLSPILGRTDKKSVRLKKMPNDSVIQLTARILGPGVSSQIVAGTLPASQLAYDLAILLCDADALNDTEKSTWTERRLSKQIVALAALVMLGFAKDNS
jgi:hypothetical protein